MNSENPLNGIPEGCEHLYGALFTVPFNLLKVPDGEGEDEAQDYMFKNPRLHTEKGQSDLLNKQFATELRESIKNRTLLNPLVCRWEQDGTALRPVVVGGERRFRALDYLISKKETVVDPSSLKMDEKGNWVYSHTTADKAYALVPCQIFAVNNDLEALALAWAENKGRVNLNEGHEVAEVMKLRKYGATDDKILEILQKDEKWLAETDKLIGNLDAETLSDLLEDRISRDAAFELTTIFDLEVRSQVRVAANEVAKESCERKIRKIQKQLESNLERKEIAEGSLAEAEYFANSKAIEVAKAEIADADSDVKRNIKERDETTPVTKAKDVKKAAVEKGVVSDTKDDRPLRILSSKKISEGVDYLDELINNNGRCLENTFVYTNVEALKDIRAILNNNILANEPDFAATLRRIAKVKLKPLSEAQDTEENVEEEAAE